MNRSRTENIISDGLTDNTDILQALIDEANGELWLPPPTVCYLISKPLKLPSGFRLVLPRYAEIRLAPNSNCQMLVLKKSAEKLSSLSINQQGRTVLAAIGEDTVTKDVEIYGGIWNFNNREQKPNPIKCPDSECPGYTGQGMYFFGAENFSMHDLTLKDPVTFACVLDSVSHFTVENITLDFNYGNPLACNMDGIHCNGNCHYGYFHNLHGAVYDDLIALNCDEGSDGPISDIEIDGVYSTDSHSAVRMLSLKHRLEKIHIRNIHGTFYQYCIGLTKYYKGEATGCYDGIVIENIFASKAVRLPVYSKGHASYVYPLIWVEEGLHIKDLSIRDVYRRETVTEVETIFIGEGTDIDCLEIDGVSVTGNSGQPAAPVIRNCGFIRELFMKNLRSDGRTNLENQGTIGAQN